MDEKNIYVVLDISGEDAQDVKLLAAFETWDEAKAYEEQQEEAWWLTVKTVSLGGSFEEKPVLWQAIQFDKNGIRTVDVDREDMNIFGDRIGTLCSAFVHDASIYFLATNRGEAEEFARLMFESIQERMKAGWFKYLRQAIYQPLDNDVTRLCRPYYNFRTGEIIAPEKGRFILSREAIDEEHFQRVGGYGPYTVPEKPLNYYDGFYSLLKKKKGVSV